MQPVVVTSSMSPSSGSCTMIGISFKIIDNKISGIVLMSGSLHVTLLVDSQQGFCFPGSLKVTPFEHTHCTLRCYTFYRTVIVFRKKAKSWKHSIFVLILFLSFILIIVVCQLFLLVVIAFRFNFRFLIGSITIIPGQFNHFTLSSTCNNNLFIILRVLCGVFQLSTVDDPFPW